MATAQARTANMTSTREETRSEVQYEAWHHWHVNWTAVWVGALSALAAVVIFGLAGVAVGAHLVGADQRVVDLHKYNLGALVCSLLSAFFAFAIAGWVTGKVAGILHSEPAMLHGAVSWLVAVPILLALCTLGAGSLIGGWFGGLTANPSWASPTAAPFERPEPLGPGATEAQTSAHQSAQTKYRADMKTWNEDNAKAVRNSALGAVSALLLGLVGSVLGGWMAAGEPMNFSHYKTRKTVWSPAHNGY
ncbi:MAG: hypothetical protein ACJ8FY_00855 [Gemmataceae bacterium]